MSFVLCRREKDDLLLNIRDVIDTYEKFSGSPGYPKKITVRWDADMITSGKYSFDTVAMHLLVCLKTLDNLAIRLRHLKPEVLEAFIARANKRGHKAELIKLENTSTGESLREKNALCEFKFDRYIFRYWNSDFLPVLSMENVGR